MRRRDILLGCAGSVLRGQAAAKRVALSFDDVAWRVIPARFVDSVDPVFLRTLPRQAGLFVCGINVDDERGQKTLRDWSGAGHLLGNHTWWHQNYGDPKLPAGEFQESILRNEQMLRNVAGYRKVFRFPMLKEGATRERRDLMREWLRERGYRNGHVTIDASDWYFDQRLRQKLSQDAEFDVTRFRAPYVRHIMDRAKYYDGLARRVLGRPIPHVLLLHYNLLNALFLGDLLRAFAVLDWEVVDIRDAYYDDVYRRQPEIVPAGEGLIWALAKETGRFESELRYPAEDGSYEKATLDRLGL